ncbi:MAG: transrane component of transporter [Nocardioides sp.]|nr:transrane component of transporter [Nocardioides sp.]
MVVAAALVVVLPLVRMARTAWIEGSGQFGDVISRPGLGTTVTHSILLAVAVTVLSVPGGALLAIALRRPDVPGRRLLRLCVLLPVLVPDFVLAYSWLRSYGRAGFTDDLLGVTWDGIQGPVGVTVVVAVNAVPLAYVVTAVGLATRDEPALERAARVAGANAFTVLRTITLPLMGPALAAAAILVFVLTLGTFAIPQVMGAPAGFATVTTRIYANLSRSSDPAAFVEAIMLALLLVVIAIMVVAPADQLLGPRLRATRSAATDPAPTVGATARSGRWISTTITGYLLLTVGLPLVALVATAMTRAVGLSPTPSNWTLDNFRAVITIRNQEALGRSILLALAAASILVVLGACVAALERTRFGRGTGTLVMLTFVLPGSTLAVGLLITYGRWLSDTALIILLAYLAKLWAVAHRPISGAVDRLPPDELSASRVSGASLVVALRTVVLRPLAPALVAAWLVCFLTALHEVTMSSLLYGPGNETFAVVVLNSAELGQVGRTAALSVLMTLLILVPAGLCWLVIRRLDLRRAMTRGVVDD